MYQLLIIPRTNLLVHIYDPSVLSWTGVVPLIYLSFWANWAAKEKNREIEKLLFHILPLNFFGFKIWHWQSLIIWQKNTLEPVIYAFLCPGSWGHDALGWSTVCLFVNLLHLGNNFGPNNHTCMKLLGITRNDM